MENITKSAEETEVLGQKIGHSLKRGSAATVIALYGELGSGKTVFVKGLATALGIPHRILSPTFLISREYPLTEMNFNKLYHFDLYRLENVTKLENLGFSEILADPNNLVVIEWAERMGNFLPKERIDIYLTQLVENSRKIEVKAYYKV